MLLLALDASTGVATAAVARAEDEEREVLAEAWASRGASEALLPAVHGALGLAGADLGEVERILVGVGPGAFTGIRIAAAVARSLSLATGAPLSINSTLAALAAPALANAEPDVLAVLDAKRRQVFARRFGEGGVEGGILCAAPADLLGELRAGDSLSAALLVVGDGAVRYRGQLSSLGRIPSDASPLQRVTAAGHVLSADLTPVSPDEVIPLYVREPDAETRRDLNPWSRP